MIAQAIPCLEGSQALWSGNVCGGQGFVGQRSFVADRDFVGQGMSVVDRDLLDRDRLWQIGILLDRECMLQMGILLDRECLWQIGISWTGNVCNRWGFVGQGLFVVDGGFVGSFSWPVFVVQLQ